ncbi:MAG: hypothetical protein DRH17_12505 [Deltaproteobacteria bacterium]|nr:MAG: hypothetical protein DRH17_12505 [Deltaproteobacteria bacterium]
MPHVNIVELFEPELAKGINILSLGRTELDFVELNKDEKRAIETVISMYANHLAKVSPTLAKTVLNQKDALIKFAGIAKAIFPEEKPITFPSQAGTIGVLPLFPQAIKYAATPSSTTPCYTSYSDNSWDITFTAGTAAYILGSDTAYYKASPQTGKHELIVIAQDGIVEVGTTPKIQQFRVISEAESKYGIFVASPLQDVAVEPNKLVYQYHTPGIIPVYHDFGVKLKVLPGVSGTSSVRLLGLVFYEHDLFSDTTWVS